MKTALKIFLLSFILMSARCRDTKLLNAEFDSGRQASFPILNLPGEPLGDRMLYEGPRINPNGQDPLTVQNNRLIFRRWHSLTDQNMLLGFIPSSQLSDKGIYVINWKGIAQPARQPLYIRVTRDDSYDSEILLELEIKCFPPDSRNPWRSYMYLGNKWSTNDRPRFEDHIGRIEFDETVNFTMIFDIERYNYALDFQGNNHSGFHALPFGSRLDKAPTIWFGLAPGRTGGYIFEDIKINHSERIDEIN